MRVMKTFQMQFLHKVDIYVAPIRNDRKCKRDGGVHLLVRHYPKVLPCSELTNSYSGGCVWCSIKPGDEGRPFVGSIYRASSSAENNAHLMTFFHKGCSVKASHILIMGNFNCPDTGCNICSASSDNTSDASQCL